MTKDSLATKRKNNHNYSLMILFSKDLVSFQSSNTSDGERIVDEDKEPNYE